MAYTTYDLAKIINKDSNAVRRYAKEFADYLSDNATPEDGETRLFSDKDAAVIVLVSQLKGARTSSDKIRERLDAGDRGDWPPKARKQAHTAPGETRAGEDVQTTAEGENAAEIAALQAELNAVSDERDYLRNLVLTLNTQLAAVTTQLAAGQQPTLLSSGEDGETVPDETVPEDGETVPQKPLTWRQKLGRAISGEG